MSFPHPDACDQPCRRGKAHCRPVGAQVRLVNTDGTAFSAGSGAYELPEAGKDTLGGIKQFAPEQTIGNVDGNIVKAAAAAPTKDEFDKLVTAFNTFGETVR